MHCCLSQCVCGRIVSWWRRGDRSDAGAAVPVYLQDGPIQHIFKHCLHCQCDSLGDRECHALSQGRYTAVLPQLVPTVAPPPVRLGAERNKRDNPRRWRAQRRGAVLVDVARSAPGHAPAPSRAAQCERRRSDRRHAAQQRLLDISPHLLHERVDSRHAD